MSVFAFTDCKKFIKDQILENAGHFGYKTKLAKAAKCQKSFLSVVLSSHVNLTLEHALGLADFLNLSSNERDYFIDLVNYARAGTKDLKKYFQEKLIKKKAESEHFGKRFAQEEITQQNLESGIYYSNWYFSAVHILLTIPEFQTEAFISKRLHIGVKHVKKILYKLSELGLVEKRDGNVWVATKKSIHLSKDSYLNQINHSNWRRKGEDDIAQENSDSIHYTGIYSISKADREILRNMIFETIDRSRAVVTASKEEDLVCFTCDFFKVI